MSATFAIALEHAVAPERYGSKAARLAHMWKAGIPTAAGFVLGAETLATHLDRLDLRREAEQLFLAVQRNKTGDYRAAAAGIRHRLLESQLDPGLTAELQVRLTAGVPYVVRSSAPGEDGTEASFAGQFDSVLECRSAESVARAIRQVWASLFGERVLRYASHRGVVPRGMAVLVQRQVESAVSGVMFTRDPRNLARNVLVVEYCAGLGEKLVAGQINPGRILIDRDDGTVIQVQSAETPVVWDSESPRISGSLRDTANRLEALFGGPQDVEWSVDTSGNLYMLQSRPITAVAGVQEYEAWTNANIAENFPEPICPLLRSFVGRGYAAYFRGLGRAFGISEKRIAAMAPALDNLVGCHGGRLYYNLSNIHTVLHLAPAGSLLVRYFNQFTGAHGFPIPVRIDQHTIARILEYVRVGYCVLWRYLFVQRGLRRFETTVNAYAGDSRPETLGEKNLGELGQLLHRFLHIRLERWTDAALADTAAMVCYGALKALIRGRPDVDVNDLLKGLPGLASAAPVERLWDLSRELRRDAVLKNLFLNAPAEEILNRLRAGDFCAFRSELHAYFETWGFRSSSELMLNRLTPPEDPLPTLRLLKSYTALDGAGPKDITYRQAMARRGASRHARRRLPWLRSLMFALVLRATQGAIRLRERARMKQALLYTRLRHVALALGDSLVAASVLRRRDDVFYLEMEEAIAAAEGRGPSGEDVMRQVAVRRSELDANAKLTPPDSFVLPAGTTWRNDLDEMSETDGEAVAGLVGTGACGGCVTGHAAVVLDVTEIDRLRPDQILITRQTDPGWAAVFFMIKGLVIERGGLLSHGAIIAREYGIPAVVGVRDATRLIGDGQLVTVDGNRGRVDYVRR